MTTEVSLATSKRDLIAEVQRLQKLVAWYHRMGELQLQGADKDYERIQLLEAENRILWQHITEGTAA